MPVAFDKLEHRGMVIIRVDHVASTGVCGYGDEGDARAVAEEVDRLEEARIPVAAALVEGDEQGGLFEELWLHLKRMEDLVDHRFEEIELGARRMAVNEAVRLHIGDGGQGA